MELKKQAAEIQSVIQSYAPSYEALQEWQENSPLIPIGDQKTGCIGAGSPSLGECIGRHIKFCRMS